MVEGQVINAKSTCVKIVECGKDFRFYGKEMPVDEDGRFSHSLKDRFNRFYEVILCDELRLGMKLEPVYKKYGVSNGAGGIFLIGRDGSIVAVDPTTEQIEAYLEANIH